MDHTEKSSGKMIALRFASLVISAFLFVVVILMVFVFLKDVGVGDALIEKMNMGTPILALFLSVVAHSVYKNDLKKSFLLPFKMGIAVFAVIILVDVAVGS